eukprot:Skav212388  [mRNA]  locus=scaffold673:2824:7938:- [translate_table: standard]
MVALASIPAAPEMSSLKHCANPEDFNVDFGRLDLLGPHHVDQSSTCVSGQSCVLKGFQYDMSLDDSVLVLDTCGKGTSLVPHWLQEPALALPVNWAFSWGSIRQTPQGGEYRLCWCSKRPAEGAGSSSNMTDGSPCQAAEHFAVDFGSLRMIGPVSTHTRTCVVGYPCWIAGLEGKDLQVGDSYLILDTCGLASHLPSSPAGFLQTATGALGTEILFPFVTSSGGVYRICWCAQGFHCQGFDDFRVDAGQLVLQGVLPEQTFTCIRGRPCYVSHVQGVYVGSQTAEFLLMATCSSNPGSLMNSAVASARAVPGTDVWWEMSLTFPGGQYRLCWCSTIHGGGATWADNSTISTSEWQELSLASRGLPGPSFNLTRYNQSACLQSDFRVDVGALHIVGPRTGHAFTCISGLTCSVSSVEGLGLTSNDSYIILDTCGIPTSVPRFSSAGEASLSADGTAVSWGEAVVSAAGGEYRLCWCKRMAGLSFDVHSSHNYTSSCESPTNFLSDVGTLLLIGVDLEQPRTCVSGSTCMIDGIKGTYLQDGDALLVLDTCGLGRAPPNIYHVTGGKPVRAFENISGHAWYLDVTETPILGGDYRLCWCSSLGSACSLSTEFQVDFGQLSVQGPRPLQQSFTCISGRTCNFDMTGAGPDVEDSLMILSTCGSAAGQLAADWTYRTSINKLQLPGDTYRLCWCPFVQFSHFTPLGNSSEGNLSQVRRCHTPLDFNIDFGHLEVIGVLFSQDRTCISGQTCSIDSLLGVHLSSFDAWSVFDTCGFQHVAGFPDDANVVVDVQDEWVSTARISWNAPVTSHGGTYRLCWCSRAGNLTNATHQCSRLDSFIDAGKFEVLGPSGQISWRPTQRGRCGERTAFPETKVLDTFDNFTLEECRAQCDQLHPLCQVGWYSDKGPNEGQCKIMQTCVSIVDDSEPTILLLPHKARPGSFQPRTCISGQMCTIGGLLGNGLKEDDSYMLLETCGFLDALVDKVGKGGVALLASKSNSTGVDISWDSPISAAGGTYRLCWCGADASCSSSESVRTDVGSFDFIGPSLRQDRTCVSGLSCLVDGIVGHHLADGDWLWILDTCSSSSTGDGFFADSWLAKPAVASGTSFSWNDLDTVPGGQYRLCWCSGQASCTSSQAFAVDIGELVMRGPLFGFQHLQMRTCISGQACEIDGLDGSFLDGFVLIMDSCGTEEAFARRSPNAAQVTQDRVSWAMLSAQGGQYQLCWCSGTTEAENSSNISQSDCLSSPSFTIHFGSLTLVGPYAAHEFTCVSGQSCAISGVWGQGLDVTNEFLVLETCGTPSPLLFGPAETVPPWIPVANRTAVIDEDWSWASYDRGNLSWAKNQSGLQLGCSTAPNAPDCRSVEPILGVAWREPLAFVSAGTYQLCWCAPTVSTPSERSCDRPESFRISAGSLTMRGPLSNQDRTCVSGQTCAFGGIYGLYIHEDDRFMILETCGSPFLPAGLTSLGMIAENYTLEEGINFTATNISESDTVVRVSWAPNTFSGPGGKYRLCWCAAGFECDEKNGLNFRTDVGALYLLGPSASFDEYDKWLRGSCSIQHRSSLQMNVSKEQCFSLARYASPEVVAAEFESQGNMLGSCSLLSGCQSFSSTDGSGLEVVFVRTSAAQHRTCVSGLTCSVDAIEGLGLTAADSFVVADTCGQPSIVKGFPSEFIVQEIQKSSLVNTSNHTVPWASIHNAGQKCYLFIVIN